MRGLGCRVSGAGVWGMCGIVFSMHMGVASCGGTGVQLSWSMYENTGGGVHIHYSTGQERNGGYPRTPWHWTFRTLGVFTLTF
jgi:hypothetical protein